MADQDRAGDELERLAPGAIAEAAAAHVGDGEAVVNLDERLGTRGDGAAAVDHRDRSPPQRRRGHRPCNPGAGPPRQLRPAPGGTSSAETPAGAVALR